MYLIRCEDVIVAERSEASVACYDGPVTHVCKTIILINSEEYSPIHIHKCT